MFSSANTEGYDHLDREIEGHDLLFRFQQQAHRYIHHLPSNDDLCSWFALMQHHGTPTRFLDWTLSPYVALYFALEEEPQGRENNSAIWAVNLDWLEEKSKEVLPINTGEASGTTSRSARINKLLKEEKTVIIQINPQRADERMSAQQGIFLCKLIHQATFNQILMGMMMHPETPDQPVVRKLTVDRDQRIKFLKKLRQMNIHRASLFPGLDGFAQSLKLDLEMKVKDNK